MITKKDGNVYTLKGPNPIVKNQASWNYEKLVFHNFYWEDINYKQNYFEKEIKNPEQIIIEELQIEKEVVEPREETQTITEEIIESKREETQTIAKEEVIEEVKEFDLPYIKYKVLCYCLPAKTKVHFDKLYGESWQKTTYGKKFIFPCVIIDSSDVNLNFWTSDPKKQIEEKSIIYPFSYEVHNTSTNSYDKVPYDEYRWWKVSTKEKKEGGWLFNCVPSNDQPDFSD